MKKERVRVTLDCSGDKPLTEQAHKDLVDVNNVVNRYGPQLMTADLSQMQFGDATEVTNFGDMMRLAADSQQRFDLLPAKIRNAFNNDLVEFVEAAQDPDQKSKFIELGLISEHVENKKPSSDKIKSDQDKQSKDKETKTE